MSTAVVLGAAKVKDKSHGMRRLQSRALKIRPSSVRIPTTVIVSSRPYCP
jgi:hypothetical protein